MNTLYNYGHEFCRWLYSQGYSVKEYKACWATFRKVIREAVEHGITKGSLGKKSLMKIKRELFALPEYQPDAFPDRDVYEIALDLFIAFRNEELEDDSLDEEEEDEENFYDDEIKKDTFKKISSEVIVEDASSGQGESHDSYIPFENYREDFLNWLRRCGLSVRESNFYWFSLRKTIYDAIKHNVVSSSFDSDDLKKCINEIYPPSESQHDSSPLLSSGCDALRCFIGYLDGVSPENFLVGSKGKSCKDEFVDSFESLYCSRREKRLRFTRPTRAIFGGEKIFPQSWASLYHIIVSLLSDRYPKLLQEFLCENAQEKRIVDFLDLREYNAIKDKYRHSLKRVGDAFYLNVNHTPEYICDKIAKCLDFCGCERDSLKIYYVGVNKQDSIDSLIKKNEPKEQSDKPYKFDNNDLAKVFSIVSAIRESFPNGFCFNNSNVVFLERKLREQIDSNLLACVRNLMFERSDKSCFLLDVVIDSKLKAELFERINEYLLNNACFELQFLYDEYLERLNKSFIRDIRDFEDLLKKFDQLGLIFSNIGEYRVARSASYNTEKELIDFLRKRIQKATEDNYGLLKGDLIFGLFIGLSPDFLLYLVDKNCEEVFAKEVGESLYFQTFEGLGIPEGFSHSIHNVLSLTEELELDPSVDTINALLSMELGYNIRRVCNVTNSQTFKNLIELYYEDNPSRKWEGGLFVEDEEKEEVEEGEDVEEDS